MSQAQLKVQRLMLLGALSEAPAETRDRVTDLKERLTHVLGDYDDEVKTAALSLILLDMQIIWEDT